MAEEFILRAAVVLLKPAAFFRQAHEGTLMEAAPFGTKKGRNHLEKEAAKSGEKMKKAINEAVEDARKMLKKTE